MTKEFKNYFSDRTRSFWDHFGTRSFWDKIILDENDFTIHNDESTKKLFGGTVAYKIFETTYLNPCASSDQSNTPINACQGYLSALPEDLQSKIFLPEPISIAQLEFFKSITTDPDKRFWLGFFTKTSAEDCEKITDREYFRMSGQDDTPIQWINDHWASNEPNQCVEFYLQYQSISTDGLSEGLLDIASNNPGWPAQIICFYVDSVDQRKTTCNV